MAENNTIKTRIVLRNDELTAWEGSTKPLLKGEIALAKNSNGTYEVRIGQEGQTWSNAAKIQLSSDQIVGLDDKITSLSTTHYEVGALTELTAPSYVNGDTAVVKTPIPGTNGTKFTYTAYVYDKSASNWKAMDGNYTADNVYFDENITCAGNYTQVGNISKGATATTTIESQGKNLTEVLQSIFTKKLDPAITQPTVSINNTKAGSYEVGTKVTPAYTVSFNPGSYTYGPATGVTATYSVTDNAGSAAKTTTSGSFNEITVGDSTSYKMTVVATHTDGAFAKDNLGNTTTFKIAAKALDPKDSGVISGYRKPFWGYTMASGTQLDLNNLTSANVRGLQNNGTSTGGLPTSYTVPKGTKQIVFACKSGTKNNLSATDGNALNAGVTFTKLSTTVNVEGKDGYAATAYNVWYCTIGAADGAAKAMALKLTWS